MSIPEQVSTDLQGREDAYGYKGIWTQKLLHCLSHFSSLIKYSLFVSLTLHLLQNALVEFDKRVQILLLLRDSKQCGGCHPQISKLWHRFESGKEKEKHDLKDHKESQGISTQEEAIRPIVPVPHQHQNNLYKKTKWNIFDVFCSFFSFFPGGGWSGRRPFFCEKHKHQPHTTHWQTPTDNTPHTITHSCSSYLKVLPTSLSNTSRYLSNLNLSTVSAATNFPCINYSLSKRPLPYYQLNSHLFLLSIYGPWSYHCLLCWIIHLHLFYR